MLFIKFITSRILSVTESSSYIVQSSTNFIPNHSHFLITVQTHMLGFCLCRGKRREIERRERGREGERDSSEIL